MAATKTSASEADKSCLKLSAHVGDRAVKSLKAAERKAMLDKAFAALGDMPPAEILRLLNRPATAAEMRRLAAARAGERVAQSDLALELDQLRARLDAARDPASLMDDTQLAMLHAKVTAELAAKAQSGPPVLISDGVKLALPEWAVEQRRSIFARDWAVALGGARLAVAAGLVEQADGPTIPYLWQDIALVYLYNGLLAEAERFVRKALHEARDRQATPALRGSLHCFLGIVLGKRGDGAAALAELDTAETVWPGHWLVPFDRFAIACLVLDPVAMTHAAGRLEQFARERAGSPTVGEMRQRLLEDSDFVRARDTETFRSLLTLLTAMMDLPRQRATP